MERVLEECERADGGLTADPVHDLRVALRRCRSMADGVRALDPDPGWKKMRKAGKQLFSSLGDLRDVQVMEEWVHKLDSPGDPVSGKLLGFLATREAKLKEEASVVLKNFDRRQWKKWCELLPRRAARFRPGSPLFMHMALEHWVRAYELHKRALRSRSQVAFHALRIGLKRFRYIVENFLPELHKEWGDDLKELQDLLGEVHDLDVLWTTAQSIKAFPDRDSRDLWHRRLLDERNRRLEAYRKKMVGPDSLWPVWRAKLPQGKQVERLAMRRFRLWAATLDPDFQHSGHVAQLASQIFRGLESSNGVKTNGSRDAAILQLAGLFRDIGRSKKEKGHHKASARMIDKMETPLGVSHSDLHLAAVVARYHRGALPKAGQKSLQGLSVSQRHQAERLAGILRLASAFDRSRNGHIQRLEVQQQNGALLIAAQNYSARDRQAEAIAGARHLLEIVYRKPVIVKPLRVARG